MSKQVRVLPADTGEHLAAARELLADYLALRPSGRDHVSPLPVFLRDEVDTLPGGYAPPHGCLLIATVEEQPAGVVASAWAGDGIVEMKRLYVYPLFRRHGVGRMLSSAMIDWARATGYERARLDVWPTRAEAIALYRTLGFREVTPFHTYPFPMVFMELDLG